MADLPMMAEWVGHAAQAPAIRLLDRDDLARAGGDRSREHRIRIRYGQDHPNGTTAQRLWAEVAVLRRLVGHPKLGAGDRQPRHHRATGIFHAVDLDRAERRFVELDRSRAIPYR